MRTASWSAWSAAVRRGGARRVLRIPTAYPRTPPFSRSIAGRGQGGEPAWPAHAGVGHVLVSGGRAVHLCARGGGAATGACGCNLSPAASSSGVKLTLKRARGCAPPEAGRGASMPRVSLPPVTPSLPPPSPPRQRSGACSGYLNIGNGKHLHYLFYTSQSPTAATDPVVLWFNGGPGCSSMEVSWGGCWDHLPSRAAHLAGGRFYRGGTARPTHPRATRGQPRQYAEPQAAAGQSCHPLAGGGHLPNRLSRALLPPQSALCDPPSDPPPSNSLAGLVPGERPLLDGAGRQRAAAERVVRGLKGAARAAAERPPPPSIVASATTRTRLTLFAPPPLPPLPFACAGA